MYVEHCRSVFQSLSPSSLALNSLIPPCPHNSSLHFYALPYLTGLLQNVYAYTHSLGSIFAPIRSEQLVMATIRQLLCVLAVYIIWTLCPSLSPVAMC